MNSIDPTRSRFVDPTPTPPAGSGDDGPPAASTAKTPGARQQVAEVAARLPDTGGDLLARAARAATQTPSARTPASADATTSASPRPILAMKVEAPQEWSDRDAAVQAKLDAFRASATPTYHVPGEGDFKVAAAFRMPGCTGHPLDSHVLGERDKIAAQAGIGTSGWQDGRVTPQTVTRLTQALIDAGKLPPSSAQFRTVPDRVRQMMFENGIGFDCASYAQQAFLAARGVTRAHAGLAPLGAESLSHLRAPFTRVAPEDARAGDIVVFDAPVGSGQPGHRAIVYDRRAATPAEVQRIQSAGGAHVGTAQLTVLSLDSSWGANGDPRQGGVLRQTFYFDASTGLWAHDDGGPVRFGPHACGFDDLRGIYRLPVKP